MITEVFTTDFNNVVDKLDSFTSTRRCWSVEWMYEGVKRTFSGERLKNQLFIPILSKSNEELILFLKDFPEYGAPCNVIIVNGDGSLRHQLCPPDLVSDQYKKYEERAGIIEARKSLIFIQLGEYNILEKHIVTMWIGFGWDFYEVREINLRTGEFGKCIRAGRL